MLPGGRFEILDPELAAGDNVDVIVHPPSGVVRRSVVDILTQAPGHGCIKTVKEVDAYIRDERESWGR